MNYRYEQRNSADGSQGNFLNTTQTGDISNAIGSNGGGLFEPLD